MSTRFSPLSHTLCVHAAARTRISANTHNSAHRALDPNSKHFSDSLMLPNVFRWRRKPRQRAADMLTKRCCNTSSAFWCVCVGGYAEKKLSLQISWTLGKCLHYCPETPLCLGILANVSGDVLLSFI